MYWFDEGSFAISYYADLPSNCERVICYVYNSMYSTLSSGQEVATPESDLSAFSSRTRVTPDGTEVTILSGGGSSAYIYVYLENSFFAQYISAEGSISDADLDAIADGLNYSLMGK